MKKTIALLLVIALALIACDNDDNGKDDDDKDKYTPLYTNPAIITQATGLAFAGKVTIKTSDPYTAADWDAVVQKVVTALNRGYDKFTTVGGLDDILNKDNFEQAFGVSRNAEIIVSASASKKIEVLSTDYTKMYLQATAINDTLDLCDAVEVMGARGPNTYELANATPAKDSGGAGVTGTRIS